MSARAPRAKAGAARRIAFLRAINVGGHTVTMTRLASLFTGMGFRGVETFIASGNVVFEAGAEPAPELEATIAARLEKALGYDVTTFVRTADEVAAIAAYEAFPAADVARARVQVVGFLAAPLGKAAAAKLMALRPAADAFHLHWREFHWLCRTGQGESEFSNAVFEKATGARATFRSVTTVRKMAAKYAGPA